MIRTFMFLVRSVIGTEKNLSWQGRGRMYVREDIGKICSDIGVWW